MSAIEIMTVVAHYVMLQKQAEGALAVLHVSPGTIALNSEPTLLL